MPPDREAADDLIEFRVSYDTDADAYEVYNEKLQEVRKFKKSNPVDMSDSHSLATTSKNHASMLQPHGLVVVGMPTMITHTWINVVVDPGNEFGEDHSSSCGQNWYTDFMTNGDDELRWYSYSGPYNFHYWCIFPESIDKVKIYAEQNNWSEIDWKHSEIGSHTEHDISTDGMLTLQVYCRSKVSYIQGPSADELHCVKSRPGCPEIF